MKLRFKLSGLPIRLLCTAGTCGRGFGGHARRDNFRGDAAIDGCRVYGLRHGWGDYFQVELPVRRDIAFDADELPEHLGVLRGRRVRK